MTAVGRLYVAVMAATGLVMVERVGWFGSTPLHMIQALLHVLMLVAYFCGVIAGGLAVMGGLPLLILFLSGKAILWIIGPRDLA